MIAIGFEKKIIKLILKIVDQTIGKKFPLVDRLTDLFQEQEKQAIKFRELETKVDALEHYLKDNNR